MTNKKHVCVCVCACDDWEKNTGRDHSPVPRGGEKKNKRREEITANRASERLEHMHIYIYIYTYTAQHGQQGVREN